MLGSNIENKKQDKGIYKGYSIIKEWSEKKGKVIAYSVKYTAYNDIGEVFDCRQKLKDLKAIIDRWESLK